LAGTLLLKTFCQDYSSELSPIMPDEFGEHLTRDQRPFFHTESLQILQIHSSMLALFQLSSLNSAHQVRDWDSHGRSFILCSVTHVCVDSDVCFWIRVQMEDPTTTHYKISSTGSQVLMFFYLLVFDRIHDTMYLDKKIQDLQQRKIQRHI